MSNNLLNINSFKECARDAILNIKTKAKKSFIVIAEKCSRIQTATVG